MIAGCTSPENSTKTIISTNINNTTVTASQTINPSATPSPSSTAIPSKTPIPTSTSTATKTPTSTPTMHPMSILAARQTTYPGSAITIEETLEPGANYYRYYAWYESEGLKIYGLLTIPFGEMPESGWPAIVFNHGYIDPRVYITTERYVAYVDQLARYEYIVFKIDYRGHDQSEGEATGAYGDPGYTTDVLNAVSALESFPQADAERIGMWGHSMGGFLTLRAMVISKDIKAGVIWSGVVGSYPDMMCCWHHPAPGVPTSTPNPNYRSGWRTWQNIYGTPEENPAFWQSISANSYLSDLSGPLELHHDVGDSEVPSKFSQDLYQEIMAVGKPVENYEYPGDDHNLANYFNLTMQRTIEFFDKYLKEGE
ncbi:MAG: alpha/beta fold hydrolase [Anaerolineales bacterium]